MGGEGGSGGGGGIQRELRARFESAQFDKKYTAKCFELTKINLGLELSQLLTACNS